MADITVDQEAVLRSFVGQNVDIGDLQEAYDRLGNFDDVVLEVLRGQLSALVSDDVSVINAEGLTLNTVENIRALERAISSFKSTGGTGLETTTDLGVKVIELERPDYR